MATNRGYLTTPSSSLFSLRCRLGWHSFRRAKVEGNILSHDLAARHTFVTVERCHRCGTEQRTEHFHSSAYWDDVRRRLEDDRLERVIRKATRHG